jgi:hypothetical protein
MLMHGFTYSPAKRRYLPILTDPVLFGLGHARPYTYQCAAFSTSCEENGVLGKGVAMNCWLPMPFKKNARIEIVNEQEAVLQ